MIKRKLGKLWNKRNKTNRAPIGTAPNSGPGTAPYTGPGTAPDTGPGTGSSPKAKKKSS